MDPAAVVYPAMATLAAAAAPLLGGMADHGATSPPDPLLATESLGPWCGYTAVGGATHSRSPPRPPMSSAREAP